MSRVARCPAWVVAALLAAAYLVLDPPSADLAAQEYRSDLFAAHGLLLWDNGWYAGHHMPGYSLLFPPLGALIGPRVTGALCAVAAAWLFERVAIERFGAGARVGALWFAAATAMNLITGRLTFAMGVALGLAAVLAVVHRRDAPAAVLAVLTTLASPIAGLFLALGAAAWWLADRTGRAVVLGGAALVPVVVLTAAFPEGGIEPFRDSSFWPALAGIGAVFVALPARERMLRIACALYAVATVASFALDTPMGGNVTRLGALAAGPLLASLLSPDPPILAAEPRRGSGLWRRSPALLAVLALPLLYWQWNAPVRDWVQASGDPALQRGYYAPLLAFLDTRAGAGAFRVEIPFTKNHWEARWVPPRFALARGWERQLDVGRNELFYAGPLTPATYRRWVDDNAVRFVAVPDARLDDSAKAEARMVTGGSLRWLRPVWRGRHWRVFEVARAMPVATGAGAVATRLGVDEVAVRAPRAGVVTLAVHFTPYWRLADGRGCVERAPGDRTRLRLTRGGDVRLVTAFAVGRILGHGPRCAG
jgi:hypothetical protein